jgi:hypothetical protein
MAGSKVPLEQLVLSNGILATVRAGSGDALWQRTTRLDSVAAPWFLLCRPYYSLVGERITLLPWLWSLLALYNLSFVALQRSRGLPPYP